MEELTVKTPFGRRKIILLVVLLSLSLVVRFLFFSVHGYQKDMVSFEMWFDYAATWGPRVFYTVVPWVDYPPFNVYIFWVFGSVAKQLSLFGTNHMEYLIKLAPNIFDLATSTLIFTFVRKRFELKIALIATACYAFNPAIIFNSAIWGQFDAVYTFFLLLSLLLLFESKPKLAAVAFMLALLTKPQSIALAPLMIFLIFRKYNWRGLLTSIGAAVATVFAVVLPLEWPFGNPISFLFDIYVGPYNFYAITSANAFNLWGLGGMFKPDTGIFLFANFFTLGWIMFGALVAFTLYFVHKQIAVSEEPVILFSAFLLFFGFFMLLTRMHERYLFPAFSVMAMLVPFVKKMRPVYAILTGTCLVNLVYVMFYLYVGVGIPDGDPVVLISCLINLVVLVYVLLSMWSALKDNKTLKRLGLWMDII